MSLWCTKAHTALIKPVCSVSLPCKCFTWTCLHPQPYICVYKSGRSMWSLAEKAPPNVADRPQPSTWVLFTDTDRKASLTAPPPALTWRQETGDIQTYKSALCVCVESILIPFSPLIEQNKSPPPFLWLVLEPLWGLFRLSIVMESPHLELGLRLAWSALGPPHFTTR